MKTQGRGQKRTQTASVEGTRSPFCFGRWGVEKRVSRQPHELEIAGSSPASPIRNRDGGFTPRLAPGGATRAIRSGGYQLRRKAQ